MSAEAMQGAVEAYPFPRPFEGEATGSRARLSPIRLTPQLRWRLIQMAVDFLTAFGAAMGSYAVYLRSGFGRAHFEPGFYAELNLVFAAVTVFALHAFGAYRDGLGLMRIEAVRRIIRCVFAGLLLTIGISFLMKVPAFSRLNALLLVPTMTLALVGQRVVIWTVWDKLRNLAGARTPVLIYGAGETGRLLAQHLLEEHPLGLRPVGFLDDRPETQGLEVRVGPGVKGERIRVVGSGEDLDELLGVNGASAVFLAMPSATSQRIAQIVARLEGLGVPFFFVPSAGDLLFSSLQFGQIAGMPVFTRRLGVASRLYETTKRLIDLAGAAVMLLISAPVLGPAALLVRLTSPGEVLFRQRRIGLNGKPFTIYKLRTMHETAPVYALHPEEPLDSRVTAVGRWLRKLSIDELPQLFNVIRGEMSLVGPRPEMPFVVAGYSDIQRQRLAIKPGLTGLWQISADRAFRIHDNIQYDLHYIENRCLALDLAILLMTPFALLAGSRGV